MDTFKSPTLRINTRALILLLMFKSVLWLLQTVIGRPNGMLTRLSLKTQAREGKFKKHKNSYAAVGSGQSPQQHNGSFFWLFWRHWLPGCTIPVYFGFLELQYHADIRELAGLAQRFPLLIAPSFGPGSNSGQGIAFCTRNWGVDARIKYDILKNRKVRFSFYH